MGAEAHGRQTLLQAIAHRSYAFEHHECPKTLALWADMDALAGAGDGGQVGLRAADVAGGRLGGAAAAAAKPRGIPAALCSKVSPRLQRQQSCTSVHACSHVQTAAHAEALVHSVYIQVIHTNVL